MHWVETGLFESFEVETDWFEGFGVEGFEVETAESDIPCQIQAGLAGDIRAVWQLHRLKSLVCDVCVLDGVRRLVWHPQLELGKQTRSSAFFHFCSDHIGYNLRLKRNKIMSVPMRSKLNPRP